MQWPKEREILSKLAESFRLAAERCDDLAVNPMKGPSYKALRTLLLEIESLVRQVAYYREDARWLKVGFMMAEVHRRAGDWLRGVRVAPNKPRVKLADGQLHPLFVKLAENMRNGKKNVEVLATQKTGRVGMILPIVQPGPHRDTRPVGVKLPSGLIVPPSAAIQ